MTPPVTGAPGLAGLVTELAGGQRVVYGAGTLDRLADGLDAVGDDPPRVLLVTDPGLVAAGIAPAAAERLDAAGAHTEVFDAVEPNPTTRTVDAGAAAARAHRTRLVVAVGGGSVLDAAKAVAVLAAPASSHLDAAALAAGAVPGGPGVPVVAVPTTAGTGAETNGFGVIEDAAARRKVYLGDPSARPGFVVLDPLLTLGLPARATAATGMDALVHGVESLASRGRTPLSAAPALQAVRMVAAHLERAVRDGGDLEARAQLLLGSYLAGTALSLSGLGLVHGIGHAVTAHTGAPHGLALSAVVAEVMARTADVAAPAWAEVAWAMGAGSDPAGAPAAVGALAATVGARHTLGDLGVTPDLVADVAAAAAADAVSVHHARAFDVTEITDVVRACR